MKLRRQAAGLLLAAIFVAADRNVAKALEAQYHRDAWGIVNVPVGPDSRPTEPRPCWTESRFGLPKAS